MEVYLVSGVGGGMPSVVEVYLVLDLEGPGNCVTPTFSAIQHGLAAGFRHCVRLFGEGGFGEGGFGEDAFGESAFGKSFS